jgi:predicted MFS family arabinose efflux permease
MLIFTVASLASVWVRNIWVLLFMRILQSIGISAPWSIGAGTIADMYEVHERGNALGIIFAGMFCNKVMGGSR